MHFCILPVNAEMHINMHFSRNGSTRRGAAGRVLLYVRKIMQPKVIAENAAQPRAVSHPFGQ